LATELELMVKARISRAIFLLAVYGCMLVAGLTLRLLPVEREVSLAFLHSVGKPAAVSDFCEMWIKSVNEHPLSTCRCVHLWITCFLLANVMFC